MPVYDGAKHTALEAERARLEAEIAAIAVKMNDAYSSDDWQGEHAAAKMVAYQADNIHHMHLSRDLKAIRSQIGEQESMRPKSAREARRNVMQDITRRWCQRGADGLDEGERQVFIPELDDETSRLFGTYGRGDAFDPWAIATQGGTRPLMAVSRSAGGGTGEDLSAAAPETWATGVVETLKYYGSMAANCHNFDTGDGNDLHQNTLDTSGQKGGRLYDQSQTASAGVPSATISTIGDAGDIVFKSFWRHSNFIDARLETFDDIHFDVAGRIMAEMTRRLGRGWNDDFVRGLGGGNAVTTQPQGMIVAAKQISGGAGSADDGSGGIGYANLLDMVYGIDKAYRVGNEGGDGRFTDAHGGMIGFIMHDNVEKQLRLATFPGATGLPIWVPDPTNTGIATQREPASILGFPYAINNEMGDGKAATSYASAATVHPPMAFGAFGHFGVRNIGGPMYYRFWDSAMAARMAVRFIGWSRRDSRSRGPHAGTALTTTDDNRKGIVPNDAWCVLNVVA